MSQTESDPMVVLSEHLHRSVDRYREDHGRPALERDPDVAEIAMDHSADQARREQLMAQTIKHRPLASRVTEYPTAVDLEARVAGENQTPEDIAHQVVRRWMNDSASARALLDPVFEYAGFGAEHSNLTVYATAVLCSDLGWLERKKRRLTSM